MLASCAARVPARPTGSATPDPAAIDAFVRATKQCGGLQTMTSELRLSGRAGTERIRGTLLAGLAAPASVRFEAVAPFGQPFFILAGRGNRASLLLPRDNRILAAAGVPEILERLIGLPLTASDLRVILTGCLVERPTPVAGRRWPNGWRAVSLAPASSSETATSGISTAATPAGEGITAYLKDVAGAPVVVAADYGRWHVDYARHLSGWPRSVRIRSADRDQIDLSATIDQLELNTGIDEKAFELSPPPGAAAMSLSDLKSIAPLRASQ